MKPTISHPTDRPNFSVVDTDGIRYYFSYETCIAFFAPGYGTVVSENVWSRTTGKHLNYIDEDKKRRVPHDVFEAKLNAAMGKHVLVEAL